MANLCHLLLLFISQILAVDANTEKVVFFGPSHLQVPVQHPTFEDLRLDSLSPHQWFLRTHIQAEFPTNTSKYGRSSWVLLHGLQERQRYEVRICWAATQPTSFRLDTYEPSRVFETPELIASLATYSEYCQADLDDVEARKPIIFKAEPKPPQRTRNDISSTLFLRILAEADYFTVDQTLMERVPPVFVDIILDPYILNIFPRSLLPTGAYIAILAIGSWYLSNYISRWVPTIAQGGFSPDKKKA